MLRHYQSKKAAALGIVAAVGLTAAASAGMNDQLQSEGMTFGQNSGQVDGLSILMNQGFVQTHGFGSIVDGVGAGSVFAGDGFGQGMVDGQSFAGLGQFNHVIKGAGHGVNFFGHSSHSIHSNGSGQSVGDQSDGDAGIQGVPLPMSALLGLGGLLGVGFIRRFTRSY